MGLQAPWSTGLLLLARGGCATTAELDAAAPFTYRSRLVEGIRGSDRASRDPSPRGADHMAIVAEPLAAIPAAAA
jgi:hypothetical protein